MHIWKVLKNHSIEFRIIEFRSIEFRSNEICMLFKFLKENFYGKVVDVVKKLYFRP